jgi:Ca-activated chloride channel family protein
LTRSRPFIRIGLASAALLELALVCLLMSAAQAQGDDPDLLCSDETPCLRGETLAALATSSDAWTIHKRVDEVTVFFTATDRRSFVPDLVEDDIRITDDHRPVAKISAFRHQHDLPLRLGLVVDTSGSVNPRFRFEQEAAIQFLNRVVRADVDRAFVLGFSDHIRVTQDYSDDPRSLAAGVTALRNGGGTALFDALQIACDKLATAAADENPAARILIVLSDGDDNASKSTLKQALEVAQARDVTLYTINTRVDSVVPHGSHATAEGDAVLKRLAQDSGGRFFSRMSPSGVARVFSIIEEEMRNRYVLFYRPNELAADGRFHRIEIIARRGGQAFHVHARKGYYARSAPLME